MYTQKCHISISYKKSISSFLILCLCLFYHTIAVVNAAETFCPNGSAPDPSVIWCDSFEDSDMVGFTGLADKYFEYNNDGGDYVRTPLQSAHGNTGLQVRWQKDEVSAGSLALTFGDNPLGGKINTSTFYPELYWRIYVKLQEGFVSQPDKLMRATIIADTNWSQAMIAHVWAGNGGPLQTDPASGVDTNGTLMTTTWNDFINLRWLGIKTANNPLVPGQWHCIEAHVALNEPGSANGQFELWIDDTIQTRSLNLDWVNSWRDYGINMLLFSNYWGAGSPVEQERYLDALVVSTERIGCLNAAPVVPKAPVNLR